MKLKTIITLLIVISTLGCTDRQLMWDRYDCATGDNSVPVDTLNCSYYDNNYICLGDRILIKSAISAQCIGYIRNKCHVDKFEIIKPNTIQNEFPDIDFTSPETIEKLTLPNYTVGQFEDNNTCQFIYAPNGKLKMKLCPYEREFYE